MGPLLLLALLLPSVVAQQAAPPEMPAGSWDAWREHTLPNGIPVTLVHAPLAEQQAVFTFLPLGFLDDPEGRPQFAHLIEHVLLRSTDPAPDPGGLLVNGETMGLTMRLEAFAPADRWREAVQRHAAWLSLDALPPGLLPAEKMALATELDTTVRAGYGHKWALAAWNEVVRHGARHVPVAAAVQQSTQEQVLDYLRERLRPGPAVRVVAVGPTSPDELLAGIEEAFAGLETRRWLPSLPALHPDDVREVKDRQATWDLALWQHLEWYAVPAASPQERVAADALALMLSVRLSQRGTFAELGVSVHAAADLVTPEGRWLVVNASAPTEEALAGARVVIDTVLDDMHTLPDFAVIGNMKVELSTWPDFATLRPLLAQQGRDVTWIEARQALFLTYAQLNMGLPRAALSEAYGALTKEQLEAFSAQVLRREARSTLRLAPAAAGS